MALQKVQMNLEVNLLKMVDDYAEKLHINRTAAVSVLLTRALQAEQAMSDLGRLMDAYEAEKNAQKGSKRRSKAE